MRNCIVLSILLVAGVISVKAQETFPVNGVADNRSGYYAFINATIFKDPKTVLQNATLIIKKGKIENVGNNISIPADAFVIDCKGKYIYPSFIDLYSDYGVSAQPKTGGSRRDQFLSSSKGAYGWNEAVKPETDASSVFTANGDKAKTIRSMGFGLVLTHVRDGIVRGTGALVAAGDDNDNLQMIKSNTAAFYSFDKGSSTQDYPTSLMGSIALLRQTYLNAAWYKSQPGNNPNKPNEGTNLSLEAFNKEQSVPQIFDAGYKWNVLRADKVGDEFGVQYIIKCGGDEYQRIPEMKATKASFIIPVNFPKAVDVEDPNNARLVGLSIMKNWEMAPLQPAMFEKARLQFAITANGSETDEFMSNLRKAIQQGLTTEKALDALTKTPATLANVYDITGSIDKGKLADFIITSGPVFDEKSVILQNWVQGKKYIVTDGWNDYRGNYNLTIKRGSSNKEYKIEVKGKPGKFTTTVQAASDTTKADGKIAINNNSIQISWSQKADSNKIYSLNGIISNNMWAGSGFAPNGEAVVWNASFASAYVEKPDTAKKETAKIDTSLLYPFEAFGNDKIPQQQNILIKNATVWTNEKDGILPNTDVVISNGKIAGIGKNLSAVNARSIDGSGKYLTAGVIDEHSHIAIASGVNECSQSVTAEVRVADVIDPDDVNIYRQLAGGVTSAHLLHGSCNTIGGQTQLIKLRWGQDAEALKFANWDPFIKFALGENVKRSYASYSNRFPDTRMGVEQVLTDAFTRAQDYDKEPSGKRKDLELEALSEILNSKRFITCHSYVQSEINMLLHVADSFHFKVNTFTHILEGYKLADKMKARGTYASTFSDWWAYKEEVNDAIPYNMALMTKVGLTVAVNSDDAEQARHLNQEAAKGVKYGGLTEEEAFKMCTLNPAIMLHVADRVGSIKVGKDADVVLWTDDPLSVYAKADKTIVDGTIYFDREEDAARQQILMRERNRLIQKMIQAKKDGTKTVPAVISQQYLNNCEEDHVSKTIFGYSN